MPRSWCGAVIRGILFQEEFPALGAGTNVEQRRHERGRPCGPRPLLAFTPVSQATHRPLSCLARAGYFFDLNGWIRVPAVFSLEQVDQMNAAIDEHITPASTIHRDRPVTAALQGDPASGAHRIDHFGFLAWPAPAGELFRQMLAHPKLVPYLQGLCGQGYRMDHDCPMITMEQGAPGGGLHGGGGSFDPLQYYVWDGASQSMHNGLIVAALQLSDTAEGDGGQAVVSGSRPSLPPAAAGP